MRTCLALWTFLVVAASSGIPAAAAADAGLVAHYTFDQADGPAARDGSAGGHDGNIHGAKRVESPLGRGLTFDGKSAFVDCGNGKRLKLKNTMTVCAWIRPKGKPKGEPVVAGEGPPNWGMTHYKGRVYLYVNGGGSYCYAPVPYHQWTHVAGRFDGTHLKLYVNGEVRSARNLPTAMPVQSSGTFRIGGGNKGTDFFDGVIDDVRVYNRVLSEKELLTFALPPGSDQQKTMLTAEQRDAATRFFSGERSSPAFGQSGRQVWLANRHVGAEILKGDSGFYLSRLYGVESRQDFFSEDSARSPQGLWQLVMRRDRGRDEAAVAVTSLSGATVSTTTEKNAGGVTLRLFWKNIPVADEANAVDVEVAITLRKDDPLTRWRINVTNRSRTYGLWEVVFPVWRLRPIGEKVEANSFACGRSRGTVTQDAFNSSTTRSFGFGGNSGCHWPGTFDMQFQALYDEAGSGLYLATHDGGGYKKTYYMTPYGDKRVMAYKVSHYPANMGYAAENYRMTYDVCAGPFRGDWYDACQIYRAWAIKQQWCARGPLSTRKDIPSWYKESPIMFSTMTKEGDWRVEQSRSRMIAFLKFLDTKAAVCWYTWKKHLPEMTDYNKPGSPWKVPDARPYPCGNIHDGNYPLLPALDTFGPACRAISKEGGYVKAYVCSQIYDPGLEENAPLAAEAKPHAVRTLSGKVKLAERNRVSWAMCYHTDWWQQRMAQTVTELIKRENVGGIYFDTFYGGYVQCFHTAHGHSHGGGNDPYLGARKISEVVRGAMKKANPDSVMSGESPAETAIDLLDGFLYRFAVWPDMAPMFGTVYGDYICRFGIQLEPDQGDFYIQCAALFTEGAQMGRLRINSKDDFLKDFGAGSKYTEKMTFLRKLCRHWKRKAGGKYLAYGRLLRPIKFVEPDPMPTASFSEPRYKYYKEGLIVVPALMSGVFQTDDGSVGIFLVNVTETAIRFKFELVPDRYPIRKAKTYRLTRINELGTRVGGPSSQGGKIGYDGEIRGHDVIFLEAQPR